MPDPARRTISDFVCTDCGLMCDDLGLVVEANRIVTIKPACPLAEAVLRAPHDERAPACMVAGEAVDLTRGVARAAELLATSRAPLIIGFGRLGQRSGLSAAPVLDRPREWRQ